MPARPESPFTPRNLVVLSDGTGNSAAKLQKTNVWRLYEALDLASGDQVALYDDGVGTAAFKPIAVLGGAFGYGLKRNVLDLYMFLSRAYRVDPGDPAHADRIYAFGFSRGAYTARVLAALVANVGLVQTDSEAELRRLSLWAYRTYRADRFPHSWPVRLGRRIRDVVLRAWDAVRGKTAFDPSRTRKAEIEFLGVWDTVAAYGLPVDELTRGWERWIWPMLPKDRRASMRVRRACHALALDDERQTFFPLLWTEHEEPQNAASQHVDEERVTQVWFAGMHSNVGGGYPDDSLSMTPLAWMATEAAKRGLRFRPALCTRNGRVPDDWVDRAVVTAPMHDSRRGLGVYYRYHPRPVERLCHDDHVDVYVTRPKIHESVLERIRQDVDGYAPAILPEHYAVVTRDGRILGDGHATDAAVDPDANPYEHPTQRHARRLRQEGALNAVWWKRVAYFLTVAATLVLVLIPLCPARDHLDWLGAPQATLASLVGLLDSVLPAALAPWLQYYQQRPFQLFVGALVVLGLIAWSQRLKVAVTDRMRAVWQEHGVRAQPVAPVSSPNDWVYRLRTSRAYRRGFHFVSYHLLPNVFGIVLLVALAGWLPLRLLFELRSRAGLLQASTCAEGVPAGWNGPTGTFPLWPHLLCNATGVTVEKGRTYRVEVSLPAACVADDSRDSAVRRRGAWADADIPVGDTHGFSSLHAPGTSGWQKALLTMAVPLRREITANWLVPVVEIGTTNPSRTPVPGGTFVAGQDGPVSMYVNDALVPCLAWDCLYRNNAGGPATVRIVPAAAPPLPPLVARDTCEGR